MTYLRSILTLSPLKIAGSYVAFGVTWILVSDRVVVLLVETRQMVTQLQTVKGWLFVGFSGLLIFGLTHLRRQQIEDSQLQLHTANQQLQVLHRVFRHNIRNDLNIVRGYIKLVLDQVSAAETQTHLEAAHQSAKRIVDISEKLDVVDEVDPALSNGALVDLVSLVESEIERIRDTYPAVSITTTLPDDALIEGDEALAYTIREVLENSIEHHDLAIEECELSLRVDHEGGMVRLDITDNGPGIPQRELDVLQTGEETQIAHASGVGLWLVIWLCRLHRGAVRFDTNAERGTVVSLRFQAVPQFSLLERASQTVEPLDSEVL